MKSCCLGLLGFWCGLLGAIAGHAADEPAIPAPFDGVIERLGAADVRYRVAALADWAKIAGFYQAAGPKQRQRIAELFEKIKTQAARSPIYLECYETEGVSLRAIAQFMQKAGGVPLSADGPLNAIPRDDMAVYISHTKAKSYVEGKVAECLSLKPFSEWAWSQYAPKERVTEYMTRYGCEQIEYATHIEESKYTKIEEAYEYSHAPESIHSNMGNLAYEALSYFGYYDLILDERRKGDVGPIYGYDSSQPEADNKAVVPAKSLNQRVMVPPIPDNTRKWYEQGGRGKVLVAALIAKIHGDMGYYFGVADCRAVAFPVGYFPAHDPVGWLKPTRHVPFGSAGMTIQAATLNGKEVAYRKLWEFDFQQNIVVRELY